MGWQYMANDDESALIQATSEGNLQTLTLLLQKGICPNIYKKVLEREQERDDFSWEKFNIIFRTM